MVGAWLETDGGAQVHLIEFPQKNRKDGKADPPRKLNPINNHSAFAIDDYQATLEHLRSHGLEVLETNPKLGQLWVADPSGNVIEFITATARRD